MTKSLRVVQSPSSATGRSAMQGSGERGLRVVAAAAGPRRGPPPAGNPQGDAERALEVARERLKAAFERIDALESERLHLWNQIALLQRNVVRTRRFAYHDPLTGLPNRRLLLDRYEQAAAVARRRDGMIGLLFLDLDGFKAINDTRGHAAGDQLLQEVAERLRASIRASDTACRYGGDEFVVLLPELDAPAGALAVARKIRARLSAPFVIAGASVKITVSMGGAIYPTDGCECAALLKAADEAMYRAKAAAPVQQAAAAAGTRRSADAAAERAEARTVRAATVAPTGLPIED